MDFNDLLHDIAKLEGLHLSSIRPGADIVVEKVDIEHGKILVKNASGKLFSRSVLEFQKIWEGLNIEPAVRVEEILHGSGSSRNQPETIMANLPYIEWLKINNQKHIAFIGTSSHAFGTLRRMNGIKTVEISTRMDKETLAKQITLISSTNVILDINQLTEQLGLLAKGIAPGVYKLEMSNMDLIIIDENQFHIPCGMYCEIKCKTNQEYIQKGKYRRSLIWNS